MKTGKGGDECIGDRMGLKGMKKHVKGLAGVGGMGKCDEHGK